MKRNLLALGWLATWAALSGSPVTAQNQDPAEAVARAEIARAEEQFRAAKLSHDLEALEAVLHQSFMETNQNGNTRDRAAILELFRDFPISALTTDASQVRLSGNTAVVQGSQTETNGCGVDQMLFTRVYVRDGGQWRLLSSTQFRNPLIGGGSSPAFARVGLRN